MKKRITTVWSFVIGAIGLGLAGTALAADAPPPPLIAETWACTYKEGKDYGDKLKARDNMVAQVEKAGLKKVAAFHWTQTKGMAPVDTVWFDVHDNFAAFAEASDAWDAAGIGANVQAAFDRVEDCTAGLSALRPFHQQEGEGDGDDEATTLIVNQACTFKHGKGYDDMPDLMAHMGGVMGSFGADGPGFAAVRQPITGGPNYPDVFVFSVFESAGHWGRYVAQLFGTDGGERMRNHMAMVLDCNLSTWAGEMVVTPDE